MPNGRRGIIEEEEKWGTAEGIITGETPSRESVIPPKGPVGRAYELTVDPWVKGYQKYLGQPTVRAGEWIGGAIKRGVIDPLASDIGYIATGERRAASDFAKEKATELVAGAQPPGYESDYATRGAEELGPGKGRFQPQREPQPVVAPRPDLESIWGITQETLPTGAMRYTSPGEGVMTVGPETRGPATAAFDEEYARAGVLQSARIGQAEREGGIIYREQVEQARRTQAETDARLEEEKLQEAAGIIPRRGMAEYEYTSKLMRMTPRERREEAKATGRARETYITGRATREAAGIQAEGVVSAAGMKARTEEARLGIQAAGVKSRIELNKAQIDKWTTEAGLIEPMKLKLQGARDAVARTKIQRDTAEAASKDIYEKEVKALETQFGMNQIDLATYQTSLNALTKGRAARQSLIIKTHPLEGDILEEPEGKMVLRNGVWVDIKTGKAQ